MWDRILEVFCKFSPNRDKKPPLSEKTTDWRNAFCFYIFGTLAFFNQEMLYTASEDILSGRNLPTATILVCFVTPLMVTKITAPWFIQRVPYVVKTCIISLTMALGLTVIVFVEDLKMKLGGIVLNAMATGAAEIVFLGLTSFYSQVCISSFVAGTGMASLVAPLYYNVLTVMNLYTKLSSFIAKNWNEEEDDHKKLISLVFGPERGKEPLSSDKTTHWLNMFCFYIFGTLSFFNQEMLFTASEDILSGRNLPTATILVSFVTPLMVTKSTAPWFIQRVPYVVKTFIIALTMALGLTIIVFVEDIKVKLVGIALNAIATGAAEIVFLGLTSFYPEVCISSFVAGTGMASLFSPLYYNGLTTWSCVSPKTAILITIPFPALWLLFYAVLDKDYIASGTHERTEIEYTIIGSSPDRAEQTTAAPEKPPCSEKLRISVKILPFIIPLFLSYFAEYMSNSSVVTTIAFPDSKLPPRDHYLVYLLSYMIGKFVGRSYLFIFACLPRDAIEFLNCDKTWIFAVLEMSHLIFFLFESWYHFVPHIWIIIALCSTLGLVAGMIALHSPHAVSRHVSPEEREFSLGLLTVGNAVGAFVAGLVGLAVEPYLSKKCTEHFSATKEFCFTRHRNTTGWETNIHC